MMIFTRLDYVLNQREAFMRKLMSPKFNENAKESFLNYTRGQIDCLTAELNYYDNFLFDMDKTLHIVVTAHWYNEIVNNGKKEEYRDLTPHWFGRLVNKDCPLLKQYHDLYNGHKLHDKPVSIEQLLNYTFLPKYDFKTVTIQLGYRADAARSVFEFEGIRLGIPNAEWYWKEIAPKPSFIIKLGNQIK